MRTLLAALLGIDVSQLNLVVMISAIPPAPPGPHSLSSSAMSMHMLPSLLLPTSGGMLQANMTITINAAEDEASDMGGDGVGSESVNNVAMLLHNGISDTSSDIYSLLTTNQIGLNVKSIESVQSVPHVRTLPMSTTNDGDDTNNKVHTSIWYTSPHRLSCFNNNMMCIWLMTNE